MSNDLFLAGEPSGYRRHFVAEPFRRSRARLAFTEFFDPRAAPINHAIIRQKFACTGEIVASESTIGPPVTRRYVAEDRRRTTA